MKGSNFFYDVKAVKGSARIEGKENWHEFSFIVKCFPDNQQRVDFLKKVGPDDNSL